MMSKFVFQLKWNIMIVGILLLWLSSTDGQSYVERYVYSEMSCEDLIPRHSSLFITTTTTSTTSAEGLGGTTTRGTTRRPLRIPTARPAVESLRTPTEVTMLNGYSYAPGRLHNIMVQSVIPFEGFMLQIRKNSTAIVGAFVDPPAMITVITCPFGAEEDNTAIDDDAPVMLNTIKLVWLAPNKNFGTLSLRLSLVIGNEYQTVEKSLIPSSLPPVDDPTCGMTQSCLRACPLSLELCSFPQTVFSVIIRNTTDNESAIITIGARTGLLRNYGAVGFTRDHERLSQMDMNVCYSPDVNRSSIEFAHLYLRDKDASPLPHQGIVFLDNSYMDGNVLWCQFTRPLTGNDPAKLDLGDPMFIFFFRGYQHNGGFDIPDMRNMMRIHGKIGHLLGLPFNTFIYLRESKGRMLQSSFALVILLNVFAVTLVS